MDYKIAIPSYKRPETIKNKTLKLLSKYNIDKKKVTVFVANDKEKEIYSESLKGEYKIVVGVPTLNGVRKFITKYYEEDTKLMQFDDDLEGVYFKVDNKTL